MFNWILFIASVLGLAILTVRKMRIIKRDIIFQKDLEVEQMEEGGGSSNNLDDKFDKDFEEKNEEQELPNRAAASLSSATARQHFMKGDVHFGRNEFDEAEASFLAAIAADETHLDSHHKLGLMYLKLENFPQAELYFSKLVNLKKDPVYFSNLGAALYRQARLIEAAEAYENAVVLDDKRGERLQSLAQVYHELGDSEKALKYFEMASRRKPKNSDLKMILVDYYEQLGRLEESVQLLKAILESDPYNKEMKGRLRLITKKMGL